MNDPITTFLEAARTATIPETDVWSADAVIDATVPNWRFTVAGTAGIKDVFQHWYADPGTFTELTRTPLPDGELVRFLLTWSERGVPHAAHQSHVIRVAGDRIVSQTIFCGGRWPAGLMAEMAEAAR
jgi:hypothetical protein